MYLYIMAFSTYNSFSSFVNSHKSIIRIIRNLPPVDYLCFINLVGTSWTANSTKDSTGNYTLFSDAASTLNDVIRGYMMSGIYRIESGISIPSTYSVTFWMRRTEAISQQAIIIGNYDGRWVGQLFHYCDSSGNFCASHGSTPLTDTLISTIQFPLDAWCHVGVTYNNDNRLMKIYFNGNLSTSKIKSSTWSGAGGRLQIGGNSSPPGKVDNIRIYSRELTATEMQDIQYYEFNNPTL